MTTDNYTFSTESIGRTRKPWIKRNLWWIILLPATVLAAMLLTNPTSSFKHNQAVINSAENKIYPALKSALRQSRIMQSQSDDDQIYSLAAWSLAEGLFGSDMGETFVTNMIADELSVDSICNRYLYSAGYHNGQKVTVGLFGHVWTTYDFMTEDKIASAMLEQMNQ